MKKLICNNCHFLYKKVGASGRHQLSEHERNNLRSSINETLQSHLFACYMGVWSEAISPGLKNDRDEIINQTCRKKFCYFFEYRDGMLFDAAIGLQKRAEENRQLKRSYLFTQIGLYIAAIGLISNVIF